MSYSTLLVNNTTSSVLTAAGLVPLGSAIHGFGKAIRLNGNAINLTDTGYYRVVANATAAVTGTAALTLGMSIDGTAIPGAVASATPADAAASVNLTVVWLIRKSCCCDPTSITFTASVPCTISNFTVEVEKV